MQCKKLQVFYKRVARMIYVLSPIWVGMTLTIFELAPLSPEVILKCGMS